MWLSFTKVFFTVFEFNGNVNWKKWRFFQEWPKFTIFERNRRKNWEKESKKSQIVDNPKNVKRKKLYTIEEMKSKFWKNVQNPSQRPIYHFHSPMTFMNSKYLNMEQIPTLNWHDFSHKNLYFQKIDEGYDTIHHSMYLDLRSPIKIKILQQFFMQPEFNAIRRKKCNCKIFK